MKVGPDLVGHVTSLPTGRARRRQRVEVTSVHIVGDTYLVCGRLLYRPENATYAGCYRGQTSTFLPADTEVSVED